MGINQGHDDAVPRSLRGTAPSTDAPDFLHYARRAETSNCHSTPTHLDLRQYGRGFLKDQTETEEGQCRGNVDGVLKQVYCHWRKQT